MNETEFPDSSVELLLRRSAGIHRLIKARFLPGTLAPPGEASPESSLRKRLRLEDGNGVLLYERALSAEQIHHQGGQPLRDDDAALVHVPAFRTARQLKILPGPDLELTFANPQALAETPLGGALSGDQEIRNGRLVGVEEVKGQAATGERALRIAILPDGFSEQELPQFRALAGALAESLLETPPFAEVKGALRIWRLDIASDHSGVGGGTPLKARDEGGGIFTVSNRRALAIASPHAPGSSLAMVILNTSDWGGSGHSGVPVVTSHPEFVHLALHELGHSLFHLDDEYDDRDGYTTTRYGKNVCDASAAQNPPWRHLLTPGVNLPTPQEAGPDVVGTFQGAFYHDLKYFRPQIKCKMRHVGDEFCKVCRDIIIEQLLHHLD